MKKLITLIYCLFCCLLSLFAQSISIKDPRFQQCFVDHYPDLLNSRQELILDSAKAYDGNLTCADYGIQEVPELIYFESLTELELNQNQLKALPSLDQLSQLRYFYVAENQLTVLPSLQNQTLLEELICWKNQLTELPDITHLSRLYRLDVPVNQLSTFPELPPNAPLKTILVDDNFITDLPDLSAYTNLQIVKVVNNRMNYGELEKILHQPKPFIYDYYPQKFFNALKPQTIDEGDTTRLDLNYTDNASVETKIKWFKDNTALEETENSLVFSPATPTDEGVYSVVLSNELFPNQPLYTNAAQITVRECPKLDLLTIALENADCLSPGSLEITSDSGQYLYRLSNQLNNESRTSEGNFEALKSGVYSLDVIDASGCERLYPETLTVIKEDCQQVIISPDGDGYQDAFYFPENGTGTITDKFGNTIIELSLPNYWDGKKDGNLVAPGYYLMHINNGASMIGITVAY